jgi:2'-5' RNA ligase
MTQQLSLFPPDPRREVRPEPRPQPRGAQSLFFALLPDAETSVRLTRFCRERGLQGRLRPFHIGLRRMGGADLKKAVAAAKRLRASPLAVAFDRVETLEDGTVVLAPDEATLSGLTLLRDRLDVTIDGRPAAIASGFRPHLTLLQGEGARPTRIVERITWTVRELALVRAFAGRAGHELEGRWPLRTDA